MRKLVEIVAKALVEFPDQIEVTEASTEKTIHLRLTVAPSDMGKVIGKQGKTANAIRTIVKAAAVKDGRKVILDVDQ